MFDGLVQKMFVKNSSKKANIPLQIEKETESWTCDKQLPFNKLLNSDLFNSYNQGDI